MSAQSWLHPPQPRTNSSTSRGKEREWASRNSSAFLHIRLGFRLPRNFTRNPRFTTHRFWGMTKLSWARMIIVRARPPHKPRPDHGTHILHQTQTKLVSLHLATYVCRCGTRCFCHHHIRRGLLHYSLSTRLVIASLFLPFKSVCFCLWKYDAEHDVSFHILCILSTHPTKRIRSNSRQISPPHSQPNPQHTYTSWKYHFYPLLLHPLWYLPQHKESTTCQNSSSFETRFLFFFLSPPNNRHHGTTTTTTCQNQVPQTPSSLSLTNMD